LKRFFDRRGQLSTLDLVAASMVFAAIIYSFIWTWGEVQGTIWTYEAVSGQANKGLDIADIFLHTQGEPTYWATLINVSVDNVRSLGIVGERNIIETEKLGALRKLTYSDAKKILGMGSYGFYIRITDLDGDRKFHYGNEEGGDESNTVTVIERMAILDDEIVKFYLGLFEE
jgi:hypothetical protein